MDMTWDAMKAVMREVLREEMAMGRCAMTPRYDGGTLILQPADPNQKAKEIPVDTFFKKINAI